MGVASYGWPILSSVVQTISPYFAWMKRPVTSALAAEDMTSVMTPETVRAAPPLLRMGLVDVDVVPRYMCPPARLRPWVMDK
jgi:hypothetical protein